MMLGGEIDIGTCLLIGGNPHVVVARESLGSGRGATLLRARARNCRTGAIITKTYRSSAVVYPASIEYVDCRYEYSDGQSFLFVKGDSLEQFDLPVARHERCAAYLKAGGTYALVVWEGEPIDIRIPREMVFTVSECGSRPLGGAVPGATKPVVTETGLVVRVPLSIRQGERILVNTETNEFVERLNDRSELGAQGRDGGSPAPTG
ncbi:MAG TPA: elongation factor P [Rectinemataceae bacterium]|nr:elongation factor P [Rectinemataceae bacterium]